jgi:ATP-dependent exoDNAse (exonuclease V) beta subunit
VHRLLERFPDGDGAALAGRVDAEAREEARRRGIDEEAVARDAGAIVRRFEEGPLAPRLAALSVLVREMPVLWRNESGFFKGIVDFVYRDGDGTIVVADWKTDADSGEALARHAAQIRRYASALRMALALDRDPRGELWMVRTGEVLEVPREEGRP